MILGVCDGHDSGAALVDEAGRLVFAVSEERLSRRKHQAGFPRRAVAAALAHAEAVGVGIARVALAERAGRLPFRLLDRWYGADVSRSRGPLATRARLVGGYSRWVARNVPGVEGALSLAVVRRRLRALGVHAPLVAIDHHLCHAWSAAAGTDRAGAWDDGLVLTLDAFGDGLCGTLHRRRGGTTLDRMAAWDAPAGPALLFGAVAQHLGYDEGDEGKVVARAAAGDPARLLPVARAALPAVRGRPVLAMSPNAFIRAVRDEPPEDVAAALQARAEELIVELVTDALDAHGGTAVALAGGVFANVAVNAAVARALRERALRDGTGDVPLFVFPAMGDAGLCAGAAWALAADGGTAPLPLRSALLGPEVSAGGGQSAGAGADAARAALLHGRPVARWRGRMEFGPRALGARSLLFLPDEPARGARVNAALGRDPVMPFGPILPAEAAADYLEGGDVAPALTAFMTVALPATDRLRRAAPAAVHRDGTARAQVLRHDDDPALHALLLSLDEPVLVNTSLNRHGEPIVATREQAAAVADAVGAELWAGA